VKTEIIRIHSKKGLKTMSTRNRIVALLLVPVAGLVIAACVGHTESEARIHGEELGKSCGDAAGRACGDAAGKACGEAQCKSFERAGEKRGRESLARELGGDWEPHPQSPYYRGKKMDSYVRIAGSVDKGRIKGASRSGWTEVIAYDSAGATTTLRVEELGVDPCIKDARLKPIGAPPPMYVVSNTSGESLCRDASSRSAGDELKCNAEHEAIQGRALALPGYWDDKGTYTDDGRSFTLACMSGVAAKCAHWGYVPWEKYTKAGSTESTELLPYYKACVHAARADYKGEGDGKFHTCSNTEFDIYDNLGIAGQDSGSDWAFEAAWSQKGAVCAARPRYDLSSGGKDCLDGYKSSADCARRCGPGADPSVLVCNRVRQGLKMPSSENICPGSDPQNCACDPFGCK
jgi:hypothetical protein